MRPSNMLILIRMVCLIYLNSKQSSTQVVTPTYSAVLSRLMRLSLNLLTSLHLCTVQTRISETTSRSLLKILSSGTHSSILKSRETVSLETSLLVFGTWIRWKILTQTSTPPQTILTQVLLVREQLLSQQRTPTNSGNMISTGHNSVNLLLLSTQLTFLSPLL